MVLQKCVMIAQKGNHSPEKIQCGERVLAERAETSKFLRLNKSVIGCSEEWGYKKKKACSLELLPAPPGKSPLFQYMQLIIEGKLLYKWCL